MYTFGQFYAIIMKIYSFLVLMLGLTFALEAQEILTLRREIPFAKSDSTRIDLLYRLGMQYEYINYDSAFYFLNQSLLLAQRTRNEQSIARAMSGIGYMNLYYTKDETEALKWLNRGIEIAKKNNDYLNLSRCYKYLAIVAKHQNISNIYDIYLKALNYAKKTNDSENLIDIYEICSEHFMSIKDYKKAEEYTLLALKISKDYNIDGWFTGCLDYYELLMMQNKKKEAFAFAKEINGIKNKLKKSKGEFIYLNDVGTLERILKNYSEAERLFLKSLEIEKAKTKVDTFHLSFIFRNLETLYLEQGDYQKAHQASRDLMEVMLWLKDKRQTQDSKLQMTKLKADLDIEKKEVEIALLETKQKQQRVFLIGVGIVALLLIAFLFFLQRNHRKIEAQKDALSELNATKNKLFAILSHDLRSPVASLKNYMMLINWGALSQSEFAESTNRLNTQLSNVGNILDNALNWSISQMEGMKPRLVKVNVFEIIEEKISMLQHSQEAKQIKIQNQISPIVEIMFDKNHFRIIIRNLLQNALKFANLGGNIVFDLHKNGASVIISITDDGVGISEEKLKTLFTLGKNDSTLGTSQEQGTGLGLVLVKELVELNGGKVNVKSELGKGTTFGIKCSVA